MSVVYTVLKSGAEYNLGHVERLRMQMRDVPVVTISDVPILNRIKPKNEWPGWWSKMEMFRPDITGDIFYMDLDTTVLTDDVRPFMAMDKTTILSDFYRPDQLQSSLMFLTAADRARVWRAWQSGGPIEIMERYGKLRPGFNGDQNFIEEVLGQNVQRWQDVKPGRVLSFKVDIRDRRDAGEELPPRPDIVIFHGKPRPWQVDLGYPRCP